MFLKNSNLPKYLLHPTGSWPLVLFAIQCAMDGGGSMREMIFHIFLFFGFPGQVLETLKMSNSRKSNFYRNSNF